MAVSLATAFGFSAVCICFVYNVCLKWLHWTSLISGIDMDTLSRLVDSIPPVFTYGLNEMNKCCRWTFLFLFGRIGV